MDVTQIRPSLDKIIEGCSEFQAAADQLIESGEFRETYVYSLNTMVKELRDVKLKCIALRK